MRYPKVSDLEVSRNLIEVLPMNLQELQDFVADFRRVSLAEMKLCFQTNTDILRPMLDSLIKKGIVQKSPLDEKCHTCRKCEDEELEFYEWVETVS